MQLSISPLRPRLGGVHHHCPACGAELERAHRSPLDRWVSLFRSVHRYRCTGVACGWEGLLGSTDAAHEHGTRWRSRLAWFALGILSTLAATNAPYMAEQFSPPPRPPPSGATAGTGADLQARSTPPGRDFHGEPLPMYDERVTANRTPLALRNSCAWGVPGSNRYRGTVEQALQAARLPSEVVQAIADRAERGWADGQVEISRVGIRTVDQRRDFGTRMVAMAFGNTLCFDTRVNFVPGHVEYASLYEATDQQGHSYSVIVPYVCQNVAVLGARAERDYTPSIAEPASWAMAALGLTLLAWLSARRRTPRRR